MNKYYIYFHIRLDNNTIFYVGKGKDKRASVKRGRSKYWKNIVNKCGYKIEYKETNLTEEEAKEREKYWISFYGRLDQNKGCLINFTDGGEGTSGRIISKSTRNAVSESNKKRICSNNNIEKTRALYKGKFGSEHNRSKKVKCVETGEEYGSMSEAGRKLNISYSSVSWSIKHKKPIFRMHFEIAK